MSDVVHLTLRSGQIQSLEQEPRLMRLQLDNLTPRLAILEQSLHDLVGEMSRGLGQVQQQMARQEKRIDAVDAGLTALRAALSDSTARIIQAIRLSDGPGQRTKCALGAPCERRLTSTHSFGMTGRSG